MNGMDQSAVNEDEGFTINDPAVASESNLRPVPVEPVATAEEEEVRDS